MFATQFIGCGDLIIEHEDPIVHCRSVGDGKFCDGCAAPLGSLRDHLNAPPELYLPVLGDTQGLEFTTTKRALSCPSCNKASWCSRGCFRKGIHQHSFLCGSTLLHEFYCSQDVSILFWYERASRAITLILSTISSLSEDECKPIEKFFWWRDYGSHPLVWTVGTSRDEKKRVAKEFCGVLQDALMEWVQRRHQQSNITEGVIEDVCSLENVGSLLGMLQCNAMEFEYPSPLQQYIEQVEDFMSGQIEGKGDDGEDHAMDAGIKWIRQQYGNGLLDATTDKSNQIQITSDVKPVIGSGLYPLLTLANHSCNPNASIEFLRESNQGSMVATRDIGSGEEICITYIPNGGVGNGDEAEYFRYFETTRTWEWLRQNDKSVGNDDDNYESVGSDDSNDNLANIEEVNDLKQTCSDDDGNSSDIPLDGSTQEERAEALLEYNFECKCTRCMTNNLDN